MRGHQVKIGGLQTDDFTDAGTGVEHQAQQRKVALAILAVHVHGFEHRLDLGKVQMFDLAGAGALEN